MKQYEADVLKIINGGYGLAPSPDGRVAMARYVLPGERVVLNTVEEKKTYRTARTVSIVKSSPDRVPPECPLFGVCGGCDLQHASYEAQLRIKRDIVEDLVRRQFNSHPDLLANLSVLPTLPSPDPFSYRQRIRLQVDGDGDFGFLKERSHEIVPIESCPIAADQINTALSQVRRLPRFSQLLQHSSEFELLLNPASGKVTILFFFSRKPRPADFSAADALRSHVETVERIFFRGEGFPLTDASPSQASKAMEVYYDHIPGSGGLSLTWEVGGFCQVNLAQNGQLIEEILRLAALQPNETMLDLYCGMGNFSIPLGAHAKSVLGIEGQGAAIRSARTNSAGAGLDNTEFIKSPIHSACSELLQEGRRFDFILIDPPRQGAPGLADRLCELCTNRLIYISCDPATLVRDLADLCQKGFTLSHIQPVDMFPQTHHIETVVLLEKN